MLKNLKNGKTFHTRSKCRFHGGYCISFANILPCNNGHHIQCGHRVPKQEQQEPPINERNLFVVLVNKNNQLFVEDRLMDIKDLRKAAIEFLDNGGGKGEEACSYCQGQHDPTSSDNPNKAVISLQNDRETNYETYITVQNELVAAYNELRERERQKLFKEEVPYTEMDAEFNAAKTSEKRKNELRPKLEKLQELFPKKLVEASVKKDKN